VAVVTGRTEKEAREKYEEYVLHASPEAGLAHFSASTGIDFFRFDLDEPIDYGTSNSIQSATQYAQQKEYTRRAARAALPESIHV
jgi:alkanesulfonate monooxygenase SsuD/methylene tetrahydromethanopterin reductase-like flavin-dependent oxidoreductase (luciferase family)